MEAVPDMLDRRIGEIVAEDYRRARALKKFGIDFCCGGGITLREACARKAAPPSEVISALDQSAGAPSEPLARVSSWSPTFLVDYIESVHHSFVRDAIPAIRAFTTKVAKVHGHQQPELALIADRFEQLASAMEEHMQFEEEQLFPAVRAGNATELVQDIDRAEDEHRDAGALMEEIRQLSDNYTPPEWACATYRAAYVNLSQFEQDLHIHVHLENNVLFQKLVPA
jgi:regulator of cell morphogenesis and NO signaling